MKEQTLWYSCGSMKSPISLFYRNIKYVFILLIDALSRGMYIDKFYFVGRLKVRHLLAFCSTIFDLGISNNLYDLLLFILILLAFLLGFNMFTLFTFALFLQVVYFVSSSTMNSCSCQVTVKFDIVL